MTAPSPKLVLDIFAGGGGASTGIRSALGIEPAIALVFRNNHGHCYVFNACGNATTHLHPNNQERRYRGSVGHWPSYAAAQEALAHHLAAGGKLP